MASHVGIAAVLLMVSLAVGIVGFAYFEGTSLVDGFLCSAMLLGGMGPTIAEFKTTGGKVFAGLFALYAGLVFIVTAALIFTPVVHRIMHKFHWPEK
jgi:hypothetical protein